MKSKLRARTTIYWVRINRDMEDVVKKCSTWQKYQGNEYLLVADQSRKCPFVRRLHSITSTDLINQLKLLFEEGSVPEIIIMLRYQHGYPWPSPFTPLYRPLLPAGPQGHILYRHRAAVCSFELVVMPLLVHVKGSTRVNQLWARPYFSSSVPYVWFV